MNIQYVTAIKSCLRIFCLQRNMLKQKKARVLKYSPKVSFDVGLSLFTRIFSPKYEIFVFLTWVPTLFGKYLVNALNIANILQDKFMILVF